MFCSNQSKVWSYLPEGKKRKKTKKGNQKVVKIYILQAFYVDKILDSFKSEEIEAAMPCVTNKRVHLMTCWMTFAFFLALRPSLSVKLARDTSLDGLLSADHVVFDVIARSILDCSRLCLKVQTCLTFTFMPSSGCRGYGVPVMGSSTMTSMPRTRTFKRKDAELCKFYNYTVVGDQLCLYLSKSMAASYTDAEAQCGQHGAHLIYMKTEATKALLTTFLQAQGYGSLELFSSYMGFRKLPGGSFRWGDGTVVELNSTLWTPGEPIGSGPPFTCGSLWNGGLDDFLCDVSRLFLCEIDLWL